MRAVRHSTRLLLACLLFASTAAAGPLPFATTELDAAPPFAATSKLLADLDQDGLLDAVVAGPSGGVVWYAAADGVGRVIAAAGSGAAHADIAAADLDADGDIDLLLANGTWLANPAPIGDPALDPWLVSGYGAGAGGEVVVGLLDGDALLDVARRDADGATIRVYRQTPPGVFSEVNALAAPAGGSGLELADVDGDGAPDLVLGDRWLANPGDPSLAWSSFFYTGSALPELRFSVVVGDVDGDGAPDVAIASNTGPGATGRIVWYETPANPRSEPFAEQVVADGVEAVVASLQAGDFDGDGLVDLVTAPSSDAVVDALEITLWRDAGLSWQAEPLAALAASDLQAADVDDDGDLDLLAADASQGGVYLLSNLGAVRGFAVWSHLSTDAGDLELPNLGGTQQTAALILDVDLDGLNDFVIAERSSTPSLLWYRRVLGGWQRHVIDDTVLSIEAGGAFADIDGDGDLDIAMGGDSQSDEIWWWENPYPALDPATTWQRYLVKTGGDTQHHDMMFGDFDGDGAIEFVHWNNQPSSRLFFAEIPADPKSDTPWPSVPIFADSDRFEGLDAADVNGDGVLDIVGGGRWFEYETPTSFIEHVVDASMNFTRAAAGQLVPGGRPELVFVIGDSKPGADIDGKGPLRWYEWDGATWVAHDLLPFDTDHGHSLDIVDFNRDGHLDIFNAEMSLRGNDDAAARIFYGDSRGNFELQVVATGFDNHESKVGDLDGDGDLDILGKPFDDGVPGLNVWINERIDPGILRLDRWQRYSVDPAQPWLAVYALPGDFDGDGLTDIASGGWWYRNSGDYAQTWERRLIGAPLNNVAFVHDFDGDGDLDLLGTPGQTQAPTHPGGTALHWARNEGDGTFTVLGNITPGNATVQSDAFVQGIVKARFQAGGPMQIALSWNFGEFGGSGIDLLTIPDDPSTETWPLVTISPFSEGEELGLGDIDGDGDLDLFLGSSWLRNDGASWTYFDVTDLIGENLPYDDADRVGLADLDGDGDLDAVIGLLFERATIPTDLVWLENPEDPTTEWPLHVIATGVWGGFSMSVSDMDNDGDADVTLGEHVGLTRMLVFENVDDASSWNMYEVDPGGSGIDHHDGALTTDFDGDGDLDIISLGWTNQNVWFFENLATTLEAIEDNTPPSAPTDVVAFAYSSMQVDLDWGRSIDNLSISGYEIHRDGELVGTSSFLGFSDTGLSELTTYSYEVLGVDGSGNTSPASLAVEVTTPSFEGEPPSVPGNFQIALVPTRADLSWLPATDNRAVVEYRVYHDGVVVANLEPTATSHSIAGLLPESTHVFEVSALDAEGNESDPSATTTQVTTPAPTTGLWGAWGFEEGAGDVALDSSGFGNHGVFENGAVRNPDGRFGGALETYGSAGNVSLGPLDVYSPGMTIMAWINADTFAEHDARILSKSTGGAEQDHVFMLSTIAGPHLRFRLRTDGQTDTLIGAGGTLATGQWIHAAATYDGATMRLYQDGVLVGSLAKTGPIELASGVDAWIAANPGQVKQVFDGRIDEVKIFGRALDASEIASEMLVPAAPPDVDPPTAPTGLTATATGFDSIDLAWGASTDDVAVAGYRVLRDTVEIGTTTDTGYIDSPLVPSTAYRYDVIAFDFAGNESAAAGPVIEQTFVLADTTAPTAPGALSLTEATPTSLSFGWGAATDDVAVTGYRIRRDTVEIATTAGLTFVDATVSAGASHDYAVTAFDAAGNESPASLASFDVPSDVDPLALLGAWGFDEVSGEMFVADTSGRGNAGERVLPAAQSSAGQFGGALAMNGSAGHVDLQGLDIESDAMTLMLWLHADDFGVADARLVSKSTGTAASDHLWMLSTIGGPHLRFRLRTSDGTTTTLVGDGAVLTPNTWIHAAATYDGTTMRLYQDGVLVGTAAKSGTITRDASVPVWVGNNPGSPGQVFDGRIDELRLFGAALSEAQIQEQMLEASPAPPAVPGLTLAARWLLAAGMLSTALGIAFGRRSGIRGV